MALPSFALPNLMLPNLMLPNRALLLIRDYSRPMTRPDWRKSKTLVTQHHIYLFAVLRNHKYPQLQFYTFINIIQTDWYYKFNKNNDFDRYTRLQMSW